MLESLVLVDAACDVPDATLQSGCVSLLPTRLALADGQRLDRRNAAEAIAFMATLEASGPAVGRSEPMDAHEIAGVLRARLLAHGQPILALHVSSTRSHTVARVREAIALLPDTPSQGPASRICLVDSRNLFAGYGVQLIDFLDQELRGLDWQSLVRRVQRNADHAHLYMVPARLDFIATQTPARGESSVRLASLVVARAFNITPILYGHQGQTRLIGRRVGLARARDVLFAKARQMIRAQKLLSPHIVVSYAGNPADVELMPGYQRLLAVARQAGVTVHLAVMAMVNAINVGPHALSVGFIAEQGSGTSVHEQD